MLSLILKEDEHINQLDKLCRRELRGEDFDIVRCDSWSEGLKQAKGEYVCFLESNFNLSDGYFHDLLDVFLDQPSFRKMAMVASAVANPHWRVDKKVYGYLVAKNAILPSNIKSSQAPYSIQIGFIPGAIIRKAVVREVVPEFGNDPVMDSVRLSLHFWENGLRCLINPRITYFSDILGLDLPIFIKDGLPKDVEKLTRMFKREMVG